MKNKVLLKISALTLSFVLIVLCFSGCAASSLDAKKAWDEMKSNLENSLTYDIYYHKTTVFSEEGNYNAKVNVHCDANSEGLILNEDGSYRNFAVRVEESKDGKMTNEVLCGLSKSNQNEEKNVRIQKNFSDGKFTDATIQEMNPYDYVKSEAFKPYTLSERLKDLRFMEYDDIDFSKEKFLSFSKTGTVMHMKFALKDAYYERYKAEFGVESPLKGTFVEIETAYDRISKIIVYREENVEDSNFKTNVETYRFELVYLGKNIQLPNFDSEGMKYTWIA